MRFKTALLSFSSWLLGGIFALASLGAALSESYPSALLLVSAGLVILPPSRTWLLRCFPKLSSYVASTGLILALVVGAGLAASYSVNVTPPKESATLPPSEQKTPIANQDGQEKSIAALEELERATRERDFKRAQGEIGRIEDRIKTNDAHLSRYYGTKEQLDQIRKDIIYLAMTSVDFSDKEKNLEEKALARKAKDLAPKVETQARRIYASSLEEAFLKYGQDISVATLGKDAKHLKITYVLMTQPLVYKFQNELELGRQARSFSFSHLTFSNGLSGELGKSWTISLNP